MKNLALAVGGTGGHIYPAVALANCVREKYSAEAKVCIFGASGGAEERIASREGIDFHPVKVVRLPDNKKSPAMAKVPLAVLSSVFVAAGALKEYKADVVMGFGGYVSFPTVAAAKLLLKLPVYLQEQNSLMGKSNRFNSRFVNAVFTSFEKTEGAPSGKCIFAGNPCRFDGAVQPGAQRA